MVFREVRPVQVPRYVMRVLRCISPLVKVSGASTSSKYIHRRLGHNEVTLNAQLSRQEAPPPEVVRFGYYRAEMINNHQSLARIVGDLEVSIKTWREQHSVVLMPTG